MISGMGVKSNDSIETPVKQSGVFSYLFREKVGKGKGKESLKKPFR